jgi:hypothetical protein
MRRLALTTVAATGLAVSAAGCGGGGTAGVASLATGTSAGGGQSTTLSSRASSDAALAVCLTSHGFPASVASPGVHPDGDAIVLGGVVITGVTPSSPQFQSALSACHTHLPGGGPPQLTPAEVAERRKALALLTACMRRHGVSSFPEPDGQGELPLGSGDALHPSSAVFQAAYKACWSLYPKVGPQLRLVP